MKLDYNSSKDTYVLRMPRNVHKETEIMQVHGFDKSKPLSSMEESVLYTDSPYAALEFFDFGTPRAKSNLDRLKAAVDASWRQDDGPVAHSLRTPDGQDLWPFQVHGVHYALQRQHALIGDQPGLGKTAQAIVVSNELRAQNNLVICPANIRLQWRKMIRAWSTMEGHYMIYPVMGAKTGVHPTAPWTIISYDLARSPRFQSVLMQRRYDHLILDEAHYLKNPDALRTQAILSDLDGIMSVCDKVTALSGTPLPNRPNECFTLANALDPSSIDWMDKEDFDYRYNQKAPKWPFEAKGRLGELQNRLRANFMVRRLKKDVLTQLPEIQYEVIQVDKTGAIRKALEAEEMLGLDPERLAEEGATGAYPDMVGAISTVRKMMGVAKAPQVADYVDMVMDGGEEKLFLVAWHHDVMDILEKELSKWGVVRIDGKTSPFRRNQNLEDFKNDPRKGICLGQMQAIGTGTDGLQEVCRHALFAEFDWVAGNIQQCVDRLHRGGQRDGVLAEFLVAPGSLDEKVLGSALGKLQDIHDALDNRRDWK